MATKNERTEIELLKQRQSHMNDNIVKNHIENNEKIDKNHIEVLDKFDKIEWYIIKQNETFATKKEHKQNQDSIEKLWAIVVWVIAFVFIWVWWALLSLILK